LQEKLAFAKKCPGGKIENRSLFGEDMDKSLRLTFWATLYTPGYCYVVLDCNRDDSIHRNPAIESDVQSQIRNRTIDKFIMVINTVDSTACQSLHTNTLRNRRFQM